MKPNTPQIQNKIDGFTFTWGDKSLTINVKRPVVHKDGRVTGELIIKQGEVILMPATQFNFSADRTRSGLVKDLSGKYQGIEWATIIDQLSHHVQELSKAGEPVQTLWTHKDIKKPEYLIEPLVYKGLPNAIYGEKGVNKSTLAILLYTCLILPWEDNPIGLGVPSKSVRPLILDWETEADIVQYYAHRLQSGMNLPPFEIFYRRCGLTLMDDIEQIQKWISDTGSEVIIIDSLGAAAGGDLKSAEVAMQFFAALRKLKTTSIIIAQTSKNEEGRKRMFGSTYFEYYSRNIWELRKSNTSLADDSDVALFNYSSNLSGKHKPIGISFHYNDIGITVDRNTVSMSEFKERIDLQSKITEVLLSGAKKVNLIAELTDASENSVRVTLNKLKKKNKVINTDRGEWGLLSNAIPD